MLPDLDSLRCFEAAASQLNFRAAAASVGLSPAAFGERIRRLEEQVGSRLFERSTRRVALTEFGERLVPQARRTLEEAARCLAVAQARAVPFELTLGTRFELGMSWLVPSLADLSRARPERRIHLAFGDSPDLMDRVRRGVLDAAITSTRIAGGEFRYESLHEEVYALVAAPRLLRRRPLSEPGDAGGHTLLDLHHDLPLFRYLLDGASPGTRWDFEQVGYLGTIAAVRHRVLEGAGIAVLPRYFVQRDLAQKALREPLPRIKLLGDHFRLVWRADHRNRSELLGLATEMRSRPLQ